MFVIPADRLPPGFAERIESPPEVPATPAAAATIVLLRDRPPGLEVLLLRRHRASGFVPGAWVFPGGRVDPADADPALLDFADADPAWRRPGGDARAAGPERDAADAAGTAADPSPAPPYWMAAVREAFEETGVLLARDAAGEPAPDPRSDPALGRWRDALLDDRATLRDVLAATGLRLALRDVVYCAHWITPVAEPRRYDTRFFVAALPSGQEVAADPREMTDAVWLAPREALERFRAGRLPMVFPTVRTIEALDGFRTAADALAAFRETTIRPVLPRLVRTHDGVAIVIDDDET